MKTTLSSGMHGLVWLMAVAGALGCGSYSNQRGQTPRSSPVPSGASADAQSDGFRLAHDDHDQVLGTLVVRLGKDGASLADDGSGERHWAVDMEVKEHLKGGLAPEKYLRVKGQLNVPMQASNREYDVGCLFVDLRDNVYYRERTWLRLATNGMRGTTYHDVALPLKVQVGSWRDVPTLEQSVTLQEFAPNSIKKFSGTLCFKLDFSTAPAQMYEGDLIVQYLRSGDSTQPRACASSDDDASCAPRKDDDHSCGDKQPPVAPAGFACASQPLALKAKQQGRLSFSGVPAGTSLAVSLQADPASTTSAPLGSASVQPDGSVLYTAPDSVASNLRVLVSAMPTGTELLPVHCQVNLQADQEFGLPDDGETRGLTGNVYKLPVNTAALPNFDQLSPIAKVVMGNIDVPNHPFDAGFPGVKDLVEWFGVRLKGQLDVTKAATCDFKLTADDGAKLWIDGNLIVNNDGVHAVRDQVGQTALAAGGHAIQVDYYQGPRYYIALQLAWRCGAETSYTIIPPTAFARPLN